MAEEPGFFSYENFPYPMLALGQTIPRGYQYQSQMTPYKRDARGDWGRALISSLECGLSICSSVGNLLCREINFPDNV